MTGMGRVLSAGRRLAPLAFRSNASSHADTLPAHMLADRDPVGTYVRVLLGGQGNTRAVPPDRVPAMGGRCRQRPQRGTGDHREQPPVVLLSLLRPAAAAAQGGLPRQV